MCHKYRVGSLKLFCWLSQLDDAVKYLGLVYIVVAAAVSWFIRCFVDAQHDLSVLPLNAMNVEFNTVALRRSALIKRSRISVACRSTFLLANRRLCDARRLILLCIYTHLFIFAHYLVWPK